MAELRIGLIGTGMIGREHVKRVTNIINGAKIVAVTDIIKENAKKVAEEYKVRVEENEDSLINADDVDAVIITSTSSAHEAAVIKCIKAGKYVFCEKPLADTAEGCLNIIRAEMEYGKKMVQVGFMRRYDKGYRQIKRVVESGNIGSPLMIKCAHRLTDMGDPNFSASMQVTDGIIHEIDLLHWLADDEYITAQYIFPKTCKHAKGVQKDPQILILRTRSGMFLEVESFFNCTFAYDIQCEVICDEGTVKLPDPSMPIIKTKGNNSVALEQSWIERFMDAYNVEIQEWVDSVKNDKIVGPNSWDGYVAAVTADVCIKAQKTGGIESIEFGECPDFYN